MVKGNTLLIKSFLETKLVRRKITHFIRLFFQVKNNFHFQPASCLTLPFSQMMRERRTFKIRFPYCRDFLFLESTEAFHTYRKVLPSGLFGNESFPAERVRMRSWGKIETKGVEEKEGNERGEVIEIF